LKSFILTTLSSVRHIDKVTPSFITNIGRSQCSDASNCLIKQITSRRSDRLQRTAITCLCLFASSQRNPELHNSDLRYACAQPLGNLGPISGITSRKCTFWTRSYYIFDLQCGSLLSWHNEQVAFENIKIAFKNVKILGPECQYK